MRNKIDWLNHGLEFIVVLIGIVIAFQLTECGNERTRDQLLDDHMASIRAESEENILRLAEVIRHTQLQEAKADSLLTLIVRQGEIPTLRRLATELLNLQKANPKKDALTVLTESGDIRFLKNYQEKREIILLYESFRSIEDVEKSILKIYDGYYYPYLNEHFDLVNWNFQRPVTPEQSALFCSQTFANTVSTYKFLLGSKIYAYQQSQEKLKAYAAQLDSE